MSDETPSISTKLYPPQSDAANTYRAHVLVTENREITKEEAVNELVEIGAQNKLPEGLFKRLFGSHKKRTQPA